MTRTASLFVSCFNDTLFPASAQAAIKVLNKVGVEIDVPSDQTCCGQIHFNTGYASMAVPLVSHFVETFSGANEIVALSGSCVAMVKDSYVELAMRTKDEKLISRTIEITTKIYEFSQYLTEVLGVIEIGSVFAHRVTYHPTCHSLRSLQVYDSAIRLLQGVCGLELVDLPQAEQCCGFGGTFSVKNQPVSTAMLSDKLSNIDSTKAEVVVAADNSCLMHIGGGLKRNGMGVSVIHLAEVLACGIDN